MTCNKVNFGNGVSAIVCTRGPRQGCQSPGCTNRGELQCDFKVTRKNVEGTCDRFICRRCAVHVGINKDYCPVHAKAAKP